MPVLRRLLVVLAVALLAASCSTADTLATVNDNEITKDDLFALRPSYADAGTLTSEQVRQDLTLLIIIEALSDAANEEYGYELTEEAIDERMANPPDRYVTVIAPPEQFEDVTEDAVRASAAQTLLRDAVVPELALVESGGYETLMSERPEEVTRACVRHISTATEAEALAAKERVEAGEDFAAVAAEVSLDQANVGGLLVTQDGDCLVFLSRAGVEFARLAATAPLQTPSGPVDSNGEWNIVVVEDRVGPASVADLAADPMGFYDPDYISALYTPWLNGVLRTADIDVSPTVGRWSADGIGIAPPGE
ncbi:MAG: peptidylprolyl isomerase [bacterium]|nr:peptidylprolyl isomerase [bacterium]MCP4968550.1 peptidylprolyl isomerase [bacterium]